MCALTGSAASLLGGSTFHSLFMINDKNDEPMIDPFSKKSQYIDKMNVVIIDEVSLLQQKDFAYFERVLKQGTLKPYHKNSPFGGKHIILVGDLLQMPPPLHADIHNEQIANSFVHYESFSLFVWFFLEQSFRHSSDP